MNRQSINKSDVWFYIWYIKSLFVIKNEYKERVWYVTTRKYNLLTTFIYEEYFSNTISNLQTKLSLKLNPQNVDQDTDGKWLFHGTEHHKNNRSQILELPCRIS